MRAKGNEQDNEQKLKSGNVYVIKPTLYSDYRKLGSTPPFNMLNYKQLVEYIEQENTANESNLSEQEKLSAAMLSWKDTETTGIENKKTFYSLIQEIFFALNTIEVKGLSKLKTLAEKLNVPYDKDALEALSELKVMNPFLEELACSHHPFVLFKEEQGQVKILGIYSPDMSAIASDGPQFLNKIAKMAFFKEPITVEQEEPITTVKEREMDEWQKDPRYLVNDDLILDNSGVSLDIRKKEKASNFQKITFANFFTPKPETETNIQTAQDEIKSSKDNIPTFPKFQ